jgi:ribbon-helix-helix CopG family protein
VEKQNITLALPKELLRRLKRLAMDRETSVNSLMRELAEDALRRGDSYERARNQALDDLRHPRNLGTQGKPTWTRDEIHERR